MKIIKQAFQASRPVRWTVIAVATTVLVSVVPVVAQIQFSDVPDDNPHRNDINAVAGQRWFVGYRDGTYKPDQKISPSEMARVLTRAFDEGLTRAEFASFMVGGNEWQSRVKKPLPIIWDTNTCNDNGRSCTNYVGTTKLYIVGYHNDYRWWDGDDGYNYVEPGEYRITDSGRWGCRWMRLGYIPEGGQNFDTIAATDAPLAGNFRTERTTEEYIIMIGPNDAAFIIDCP